MDRLETAEFLRMALDELGLSICGSWETGREAGGFISAHFPTVNNLMTTSGFRNTRWFCLTQLYIIFKHKLSCDKQEYEKRLFCFKPKCQCGKFKKCMWPLDWSLCMCVCTCLTAGLWLANKTAS